MSSDYDSVFDELRAEISVYSPSAARILDQIKQACGAQTAYYAAFVIVCLKAQQALPAATPLDRLTREKLTDFTFFEVAKDNQTAIRLFDEALRSYRRDHASHSQ